MNRRSTRSGSILLALFAALALLAAACAGAGSSQTTQAPEDTEVPPASEPEPAPAELAASTETAPAVATAGGEEHADAAAAHEDAHAADQESPKDGKKAATAHDGKRTISVEMTEFAYGPSKIKVKKGETVRFVFRNTGAVEHEALIGDRHLQDEHEAEMLAGDAHHGDGHHGDLSTIRLGPGEKGTLEHTFDEAGKLILGCHIPGHWDAGMKATIDVRA